MDNVKKPQSVEELLHEREQKLSTQIIESFYRENVTVDPSKSPQFTALLISYNYSISDHLSVVNSSDESVVQQLLNMPNTSLNSSTKSLVLLDICKSDNGFIDNEITNFAYSVQESLAEKGLVLIDYILASKNSFVSLREAGIL